MTISILKIVPFKYITTKRNNFSEFRYMFCNKLLLFGNDLRVFKEKTSCYNTDIIKNYSEYFLIKHLHSESPKKITGNRFIFRMLKCLNRCSIILWIICYFVYHWPSLFCSCIFGGKKAHGILIVLLTSMNFRHILFGQINIYIEGALDSRSGRHRLVVRAMLSINDYPQTFVHTRVRRSFKPIITIILL